MECLLTFNQFTKSNRRERNSMSNNAVQVVISRIEALLSEEPEVTKEQAYFKCREGITGLKKEDFTPIFERVKEQVEKPLHAAALSLARKEGELQRAIIDELYQKEPEGPAETRELLGIATRVRNMLEVSIYFQESLLEDLAGMGLLSKELLDKCHEVWPVKLGEAE